MRHSLSRSIRTQLLLLVLITVLPALGIVLYSGLTIQHQDIERAESDALRVVHTLAYDHERTVESTRQFLVALARFPDVQNQDAEACNRLFGELLKENPLYANIFSATAEGMVFSNARPFTPHSIRDRKYFQDVLRTMDFSVGEYAIGVTLKQPVLHFAYPIRGDRGGFKGIVVVAFDLNRYGHVFSVEGLPADSRFSLFDHKSIALYRHPDPEKYMGKADIPDMIRHMSREPAEGVFTAVGRDQIKCLYAYKRFYLKGDPSPYLFLRVGIPQERALSHARNALVVNLALLGGALLMAMVLAWFLGRQLIVQRLRRLVHAAQRLGHGDLQARTGLNHSQDELGQVIKAFDDMAGELEGKEAQRKSAEGALRESEERYRDLYDQAPVGYHEYDTEGRITRVNRQEMLMLGYGAEEMLGQPTWNFIVDKEAQEAQEMIRAKLAGLKPPSKGLERTYRRKDGTSVPVLMDDRFLTDNDGRIMGVRTTIRDNTERQRAEQEQLRMTDEIRLLLQSTGEGIYGTDTNGLFTFINRAGAAMLGYSPEELIGKPAHTVVHHSHADGSIYSSEECPMNRTLQSGQECRMDNEVLWRKDGASFFVEYSSHPMVQGGEIKGVVVTFSDITGRKKAEEALRELDKNLLDAQKIAHVGFWDLNVVTGDLYWSDETYRIYGFKRQEFVPTYEKFQSILLPEDREIVQENVDAALRGEADYDIDFRFVRSDGKIGWIHCEGEVTRDEEGNAVRFFGVQIEITERKQVEEALEEERKRLQKALDDVRTLRGIVPICANCKKIRDDKGYWSQVEKYVSEHSEAKFSHGICPECAKKYYPDMNLYDDDSV